VIHTPGGIGSRCLGSVKAMTLLNRGFGSIDGLAAGKPLRRSACNTHHAQRDDKRHHAQSADGQAVDQSHATARGNREGDGDEGESSLSQGHVAPTTLDRATTESNAQINPAADDDQRHSQCGRWRQ
jgi:hypothetical protein